jgi:hypothetical protein
MPAKAGIQDFEKLNKTKNWIPAFAGMTTPFPNCDTASQGGGNFFSISIRLRSPLVGEGFGRELSRTVG